MQTLLTDLGIFPALRFEENEYARLQMRLDLFEDRVVATRYQNGTAEASFIADPLAVAQALAGLDVDSGLLPGNVLFWQQRGGQERVGLWLPPDLYLMQVEQKKFEIPLPGLVLVGQGKKYSLFAVTEAERPGPETDLYHPPCPNVSGSVCRGNVPFPVAGASTMGAAARLFFDSGFNGHLANGKSRKYPDNILRMWRVLNRIKAEEYPLDDLVMSQWRLKDLVKR